MAPQKNGVVYIDDPIHGEAIDFLRQRHQVICGFGAEAVDFEEVSAQVEGILVRTGRISSEMIASAPKLKVIARHGVGTDAIDIQAAHRQSVHVLITPQANAISVAEHTIGLLFAAARQYSAADSIVREGLFVDRDRLVGLELAGKTLAIAGFGRVGARVAQIAEAIGMHLRVYDPYLPSESRPKTIEFFGDLESLLSGADALTLHLPLTPASKGMIGGRELDRLKVGAIVVNTARGGLIDEAALARRLVSGRLSGAGIDVFSSEPEPPLNSPLLTAPSVFLTPHTGAHTSAAMRKMAVHAADGISAVLRDDQLPNSVVTVQQSMDPARPVNLGRNT